MTAALAALLVVVGGALLLLAAIAKKLIVDEVSGWLTPVSQRLIRRAAAQLPRHSERYEKEWLAELEALRERKLTGLLFAIGILRGAKSTGSALEDLAAEAQASQESEWIAPMPRIRADPEAVAELIRRLVERNDARRWTWADVLAHMRAAGSLEVSDEIDRATKAFSQHTDSTRKAEPYDAWRTARERRQPYSWRARRIERVQAKRTARLERLERLKGD